MLQRSVIRAIPSVSRHSQQCLAKTASSTSSPFKSSSPSPALRRAFASPSASHQPWQRRTYSTETEAKKDEKPAESTTGSKAKDTPAAAAAKEENPLQKELEAKKAEVIDLTDRVKRSVADYRNLQEQTKREVQAAKDFALQRFAKDLLDSIDNLDRAVTNVPQDQLTPANKDLVNLHDGLKMTEKILLQTLAKHGLERFDPAEKGDKFDPNKMEATFMAPQPDKEDGVAFFTQSKGFLLNGRVMRAAKVGVVKNA